MKARLILIFELTEASVLEEVNIRRHPRQDSDNVQNTKLSLYAGYRLIVDNEIKNTFLSR